MSIHFTIQVTGYVSINSHIKWNKNSFHALTIYLLKEAEKFVQNIST